MSQTASRMEPTDAAALQARFVSPLLPAEEFARFWAQEASLDGVLQELEHDRLQQGAETPEPWREEDLDQELADAAWAVARRMLRANDAERSEIRALTRISFRHVVGAMLAGAMPRGGQVPEALLEDVPVPPGPAPALDGLVRRQASLPGDEPLVRGVVEAVAHPLSNAERVARAVAEDRTLSILVLGLVNSESFGLDAAVHSLDRAVSFVGLGEMQTLALAVSAIRELAPARDLERIWRRGVTCGVAARLLAKRLGMSGRGLLSAGMLHQAGELLLEREAPRHAAAIRSLAGREGLPLDAAQRSVLGYDGAEAAGRLLDAWDLADTGTDIGAEALADLVRNRHRPHLSQRPDKAAVLHLSAVLAHLLDLSGLGRIPAPVLDLQAWCGLCLPASDLSGLAGTVMGERYGLVRALRR